MNIDNKNELPPMDGLLPKLAALDTDYRKNIIDVLGNPYMGPILSPQTIDLDVQFERVDNTSYYKFSRCEKNGTGLGMTRETTINEFFGVPKQRADSSPKTFLSVHNLGEKLANVTLSSGVPSKLDGFTIVTKTKDSDKYLYGIFNPMENEWISKLNALTYEQAKKINLPVDEIGDKGTYLSYHINTEKLGNGVGVKWYDNLIGYVENVFAGYLDGGLDEPIYNLNFKLISNGLVVDDTKLKPKIMVYEDGKSEPTQSSVVQLGNKAYNYTIGKRAITKSDIGKAFDDRYPNRRALVGKDLIHPIGRHECIILKDKDTGYKYDIAQVLVQKRKWLEYVVIEILVSKEDLITDATKNKAHLKDSNGKPIAVSVLHRELNSKVAAPTYEINDEVNERKLREQLVEVLTGRKSFHPTLYKELAKELDIPINGDLSNSYQYCEKNLQVEYPLEGVSKSIDIMNQDNNHIMELKVGEPDPDKDLNQIGMYGFMKENTQKITTIAVSNKSSETPMSSTSNFDDVLLGKFSVDLNNHKQSKHIKWKLIDLRYFGLHKII